MLMPEIPAIPPVDELRRQKVQGRFDRLIKPVGSLARLEEITGLYAAARKIDVVAEPAKTLLFFVSDHGAAADGPTGKARTAALRKNVSEGKSALNILADRVGASIAQVFHAAGKIRTTGDIRKKAAMTEDEFKEAFLAGQNAARAARAAGAGVIGLGRCGRGASLSQAALLSALFGEDFSATLNAEERALQAVVCAGRGNAGKSDLIDAARRLGGLEIPAMAGSIIQAAGMGMPVFLDGVATLLAAFIAESISPGARNYLIAVSSVREAGQNILLTRLGLSIMLDLELPSPSGEASLLGFDLLRAGIKALNEMDSFGRDTVHHPLGDI
jgi:nicotinate-nucleotide--dimethylbenzimidazole phosphoribosyltransferase